MNPLLSTTPAPPHVLNCPGLGSIFRSLKTQEGAMHTTLHTTRTRPFAFVQAGAERIAAGGDCGFR